MSGSNYQQAFFTVPNRIINLPGLTLQLLRFYEKIFQYWHHDSDCFIGNDALMEHCGMKSESSLSKAFQFFEKAGEIKRETRENGQRYIIQPPRRIEIKQEKDKKLSTSTLATARGNPRASETPSLATARHNNNNSNNKNLNKSSCATPTEKSKASNEQIPKNPRMNRSTMKAKNEDIQEWEKKKRQEVHCTAKFWGPGHPSYDSLFGKSLNNNTGNMQDVRN